MNYKNKIKTLALGGLIAIVSSCQLTELDINTDPNRPATGSLALLLPVAENAAINAHTAINNDAMGFAGLSTVSDSYNLSNTSYQGTWNARFRELQIIEEMLKSSADGKNPRYRGIALTLKAFSVGHMVDMFGDIPYSEAWKGNAAEPNKTPKFDKDSEIYEDLLKLCDQAVAELAKPQPVAVQNDYIGGGNAATWTRIAKTVKLRLLLTSRKGRANGNAELKAAFEAGGFISTPAQNWSYLYSKQISPQRNTHPWYSTYAGLGDPNYINHQLMGEMILNKDPRLPFYFYRQTSRVLDQNNPTDRGTTPFGGSYLPLRATFLEDYKKAFGFTGDLPASEIAFIAGYFGRDRGDVSGAAADGPLRTTPGCYPAGGVYSDKSVPAVALTGQAALNTGGDGQWPVIHSWNTKYYQIEAILDNTGVTGDAKALFKAAMEEQIAVVVAQGLKSDPTRAKAPAAADIAAYVNEWLKLYDAAASNSAKLNVVAKQLWFCSWGQGMDIWNFQRRTGFPIQSQFRQFSVGIMAPISKPPRQYALRLPYPQSEGALNPANAQKYINDIIFDRDPIFWDKVKVKWEF
ncbi:SusD/RagB family nutrient-binding outer membrane lipoprotein [Runella rosea]|uniref:SusD/RagB family nutrient-binding outer membrane lipoprotein n=1 Tax=Runella rosea TaxID=2259595 RepID=A0A344TK16_9BACT|nr:SusD/RagB family nutrient-binding outer membrane lipoprotein [Runella rosea]AXE18987.1 SusD/RagB family nutrient-binding outer membrane lipoprotein [Runella rosea]